MGQADFLMMQGEIGIERNRINKIVEHLKSLRSIIEHLNNANINSLEKRAEYLQKLELLMKEYRKSEEKLG